MSLEFIKEVKVDEAELFNKCKKTGGEHISSTTGVIRGFPIDVLDICKECGMQYSRKPTKEENIEFNELMKGLIYDKYAFAQI